MGLLSTATAANRKTERLLTVTYSRSAVKGKWAWVSGNVTSWRDVAYEVHRYASCAYRYVGMDYASALAAAKTIRASYTRAFKGSEWHGSGTYAGTFRDLDMGKRCQASVEVVRTAGHLYDVVVDVSEDDMRMSLQPSGATAALFAAENKRQYDY